MRVCILGDSHVGCFKQAWDSFDEKPAGLSVDFVASPGAGLSALQALGDHIGTTNHFIADQLKLASGGPAELRPADYDAFLIVGLGLWVAPIADGISSAVFAQCCEDLAAASLSLAIGKLFRGKTDAPIYVAHNPLPAAVEPYQAQRSYADLYENLRAVFDHHDMRLLRQPAETVLLPYNSAVQFSRGAKRLVPDSQTGELVAQPADDIHHMNVDYGLLHFRDFLKRLEADAVSSRS